jgi:cytoskeletal protein CcmA (bactofilin family)
MFGRRKRIKSTHIDSFIGELTEISGDIRFSRDLAIVGTVNGNVLADEGTSAVLSLSETGRVEGEIRVPNVVVNGTVIGDVYATERVQLAANARVSGNVYYHLIEMEMGAEVNGSLVRIGDVMDTRLTLGHEPPTSDRLRGTGDAPLRLEEPGGDGVDDEQDDDGTQATRS